LKKRLGKKLATVSCFELFRHSKTSVPTLAGEVDATHQGPGTSCLGRDQEAECRSLDVSDICRFFSEMGGHHEPCQLVIKTTSLQDNKSSIQPLMNFDFENAQIFNIKNQHQQNCTLYYVQ